jgi:hypothetical protein
MRAAVLRGAYDDLGAHVFRSAASCSLGCSSSAESAIAGGALVLRRTWATSAGPRGPSEPDSSASSGAPMEETSCSRRGCSEGGAAGGKQRAVGEVLRAAQVAEVRSAAARLRLGMGRAPQLSRQFAGGFSRGAARLPLLSSLQRGCPVPALGIPHPGRTPRNPSHLHLQPPNPQPCPPPRRRCQHTSGRSRRYCAAGRTRHTTQSRSSTSWRRSRGLCPGGSPGGARRRPDQGPQPGARQRAWHTISGGRALLVGAAHWGECAPGQVRRRRLVMRTAQPPRQVPDAAVTAAGCRQGRWRRRRRACRCGAAAAGAGGGWGPAGCTD